ncbi:hypothetical protein C8A05DRAFT_38828 [Staphylotrichum tortipilum]|uniref:Uncharacterized protein n=1 Tax=Staphylotrichum tortipilum TaxID=2831512 RepID=A0AAN6MCQ2_9PEZI|nr:hypothetical protein C8A05DRAFT_38828 [Staphylotrichum longicolle]
MRAAESALLAYLRGLRDAVYYYDAAKGLVEPPAEMEFAPSRIDQKEHLVEIYNIERELLSDIAGITDLREIIAQIRGAE